MISSVRRFLFAAPSLLALAAATVLAAPAAQADPVSLSACNSNTLSQAFLPWGDPSNYEVAPGGTFGDSSWALSGGATIVPGAEPFAATGTPRLLVAHRFPPVPRRSRPRPA